MPTEETAAVPTEETAAVPTEETAAVPTEETAAAAAETAALAERTPSRATKTRKEPKASEEVSAEATPPATRLPPHAFWKGSLIGLVLGIPATAVAAYVLARTVPGNGHTSFTRALLFASIFAGLPGAVTAGGVGRAAARIAVAPGGGPARCARRSATAFAVAGMGMAVLTALPLGWLAAEPHHWWWLLGAGGIAGAAVGAVIGLWIGRPRPDERTVLDR